MKKIGKFLLYLLIGFIILCLFVDDEEVDEPIENQGTDTFTLMVYMCGSDLESSGGYASDDIDEMLRAQVDEKVNLIIETGGTTEWQDHGISSSSNQIYKVEDKELILVKDNLGIREMTSSNTLTDFINFCKSEYPADKYGLILWDHGGGAVSGFGYDENAKDENDTLTIDEIKRSLSESDIHLDFLGFDACLMATVETAYSLKDNAHYLIASEETEPGTGWDYKKVINKISSNTSADALDISKTIVDSFIDDNNGFFSFADATLSVIDLTQMNNVYKELCEFMNDIKVSKLDARQFASVSKAIDDTKQFGDGDYDTIDLIDFAKQVNNGKTNDLVNAVQSAVAYYKNSDLVEKSNGLTIYWPYSDLSDYDKMLNIYNNIGMGGSYTDVLTQFVNLMAGGRKNTKTLNNKTYEVENANYSDSSWYNQDIINSNASYFKETEYGDLEVVEKGDTYVLKMTDEAWDNITSITCEVMLDDGEGYVDLGSDDYYEIDSDGDLDVNFDGTWVAIEGQVVPFYVTDSTDKIVRGNVPAVLNGRDVDLIVIWTDEYPDGKVVGATPIIEYGDTNLSTREMIELKKGDKIDFVVDYYTYDEEYDSSYEWGETIIVKDPNKLKVSFEEMPDDEFLVYYKITDIYNNEYYTEPITVY